MAVTDQLDMQIAMEVATIRRLVNELRQRLGLEPRVYCDQRCEGRDDCVIATTCKAHR